jgi:N-methylhydantoinase B/oxoprolinase/acetone carboxylase alpha subunit
MEVIEHRYPISVERHELLPALGGAGRFRGGPGVARDYRILEPGVMLQFTNENVRDPIARGRHGGEDGRPGELVIGPGTDRETTIRDRVTSYGPLPVGTVLSSRSGGGGGYGVAGPLEEDAH